MIKIIYYLRWICFLGILTGCMISAFSHKESHQSIFWFSTLIYGFSNLTLYYLASKIKTSSNNQKIILSAIIFDSLFLFILITQLGGSHNPFAIVYIFIACVSASSLNRNHYLASIMLILILLGVIYSGWFDHHHHQPANLKNHLQGMWIANSLAVLIGSLWIYYLRKHNQTLEIKNLQNQKIIFDLEKMDSLGKMMATTSHKINTSLGTIKLGLGELSDPSMMNNQKEYKEWIEHCKTALTQIEEVIGKMQSHQKESFINNEQQVDLVDFLKLSTTHWAKPRKVELEINSFTDKVFTNFSIGEEIRDIIFLLFDNSYQAYDHAVSPKIIFSIEKNFQNLTLIIQDFGTGMEEEIKNKVFEPLFTTKPQGTGIGLYSCYQTVKKLNGKIDIESKNKYWYQSNYYYPDEEYPMMKKKLLIIEDDHLFSESLKKILTKKGFDCLITHNAHEAMTNCKTYQPTHIILDLKLGIDDGEKLISPLREQLPQAMIIILTGYGTIPSAVKALKNGANDYLTKPIDIDELIKHLDKKTIPAKKELKELEDEYILDNLKMNDGNITKTAKDLGLHRRTLQRKLKKIKDYY